MVHMAWETTRNTDCVFVFLTQAVRSLKLMEWVGPEAQGEEALKNKDNVVAPKPPENQDLPRLHLISLINLFPKKA